MDLDNVREKLRKLASADPQLAQSSWLFYLSAEGPERGTADDLLDLLLYQLVQADYRRRILLDPPPPTDCRGEYELGNVLYPPEHRYAPFGLREDEWIKHVLIVGMTGSGKTNLGFLILRELQRHGKPLLVFDWKRNYRDLLQVSEFFTMRVFTVGRSVAPFRFNPLIPPPGTTAGEWIMRLVDVIKHAYFVGDGVEYLLREAIDSVYEECGIFGDNPRQSPNFFQVRAHVTGKRLKGRMSLWQASAIRVLESLCFVHGLGPVVNTGTQWDYKDLLNRCVVLELDALSDADKTFFTEALILWLYCSASAEMRLSAISRFRTSLPIYYSISDYWEDRAILGEAFAL